MSFNFSEEFSSELFDEDFQNEEHSSVTRSIRSMYGGYRGFNSSSHSLSTGNGGLAVLSRSASATNNNITVSRIAQDLLELQKGRRNFGNLSQFANFNLNLSKSASGAPRAVEGTRRTSFSKSENSTGYLSEIEASILRSVNPIDLNETEEIEIFGQRGIWANKSEIANWKGLIPITEYEINQDSNPEIITKRTQQQLEYVQELAIRYLRPPTPPAPGEIIINQQANTFTRPAPPLIIRQQPARPDTPEPLVIREAPPQAPALMGRKVITISGKRIPPPPRKVVIERLAPLPSKPQSVLVERWLPYSQVKRRVIFNKSTQADPVVVKPRNIIVQWEAPQVQIKREYKYLGVIRANPVEYVQRYSSTLLQSNSLPQFVQEIKTPHGIVLAANLKQQKQENYFYELEGDVQALKLIDLDKEGLSEYRSYLAKFDYSSEHNNASTSISTSNDISSLNRHTISQHESQSLETLIEHIFRSIDRNNNGSITVEDAQKILLRLNSRLERKYGEDDVRAFFNALDVNNDATLDIQEFKRAFLNLNNSI